MKGIGSAILELEECSDEEYRIEKSNSKKVKRKKIKKKVIASSSSDDYNDSDNDSSVNNNRNTIKRNKSKKVFIASSSSSDDYNDSDNDSSVNNNRNTIKRNKSKKIAIASRSSNDDYNDSDSDSSANESSKLVNNDNNDDDGASMHMKLGYRLKDSDNEDDEDYSDGGKNDDDSSTDDNDDNHADDDEEEYELSEKDDTSFEGDDECSDNESDDDDESVVLAAGKTAKKTKKIASNKKKKPCCSSRKDAITEEELETPHICWESPNKSLKQCFNLSTLIRVAKTINGNKKKDFMQPPHFRCAMDMHLRQQIKEKFGAKALRLDDDDAEEDYEEETAFQQRLERYLHGVMGSSDLYLCPLCYSEAYRRYINNNNSSSSSSSQCKRHPFHEFHFQYDPITVLLNLDDQLHIASTFSFRKMADVKTHLKTCHRRVTDIKNIDNALYTRFQIRASDGLLQRYLEYFWKRDVDNKDMANYWHEGNNVHFLHLLNLVESQFHGVPMSFNVGTMWDELANPYSKKLNKQDRDFVVMDDEEIQYYSDTMHESDISVDEYQSCINPEESVIKELRRRRWASENIRGIQYYSDDMHESDNSVDGHQSCSNPEESDIKELRRRRGPIQNARALLSSDDDDDESAPIVSISPQQNNQSAKRKRTLLIESDSDTDEDINASPPACKLTQILSSDDELPPQASTAKPRTQIHESDDDDDDINSISEKVSINQQIDSFLKAQMQKLEHV